MSIKQFEGENGAPLVVVEVCSVVVLVSVSAGLLGVCNVKSFLIFNADILKAVAGVFALCLYTCTK